MKRWLLIFAMLTVCSCSLDPALKGKICPPSGNNGINAYIYDGEGELSVMADTRCPDEEPYCTAFTSNHIHSNHYFCHPKCTGGDIPCNGGCKKPTDPDFDEACRKNSYNPSQQNIDTECPSDCANGCHSDGSCVCPNECQNGCDEYGKCNGNSLCDEGSIEHKDNVVYICRNSSFVE